MTHSNVTIWNAAMNLSLALKLPIDKYALYFDRDDVTMMLHKKVARLQGIAKRLRKGFYLNFKDPFRKELNG